MQWYFSNIWQFGGICFFGSVKSWEWLPISAHLACDRVKDTDFGDIFDLSPISVLFTQILYDGVSYRNLWQNCFSIYLNCNQNLRLSFQQYMFYVCYRFWWQILFPDWTFLVKLMEVSQISVTSTHIFIKGVTYRYLLQLSINLNYGTI